MASKPEEISRDEMLQRIEQLEEERADNPVHLLTNPPAGSWMLNPMVQAAAGGVASALIDAVVTKAKPDTTGLAISAVVKGGLGVAAAMYKPAGRKQAPAMPFGAAMMGAAGYQGSIYAAQKLMAYKAKKESEKTTTPPAAESGAYIPQLPPGYTYVPGVGYVPPEMLGIR